MLRTFTIRTRMIFTGLAFILAFSAVNIYTIKNMVHLGEGVKQGYQQPFVFSSTVLRVSRNIARVHSSMKDLILATTPLEINQAVIEVDQWERLIYQDFDVIKGQLIGDPHIYQRAVHILESWAQTRKQIIDQISRGEKTTAAQIIKIDCAAHMRKLDRAVEDMILMAQNRVHAFIKTVNNEVAVAMDFSFLLQAIMVLICSGFFVLLFFSITKPISQLKELVNIVSEGNFLVAVDTRFKDEVAELARAFEQMIKNLGASRREIEFQTWLKEGESVLNQRIRQENQDTVQLADSIIQFIAPYVNAMIGAVYLHEDKRLKLKSSYAFHFRQGLANEFDWGEGIVGQAGVEKKYIVVDNIPDDYINIQSGLGRSLPRQIIAIPFLYADQVSGVIELGTLATFDQRSITFLENSMNSIAVAFNTRYSRLKIDNMLEDSQAQALEVQGQSEKLQVQQEELRQTNQALEDRTRSLEQQQTLVNSKNRELEKIQIELQEKAKDLLLVNKYKSEFLANMSHELRTPLNSMLILSKQLATNKKGNLDAKQVEYATTCYTSGQDLLFLINQILDLAKIESGRVDIELQAVKLTDFQRMIKSYFRPVATKKGLELIIEIASELPATVETDQQKVDQILKNLIGNALKFTSEGFVKVVFQSVDQRIKDLPAAMQNDQHFAILISDSGTGIADEKIASIFEAFRQADGTISRKYGGTGLGLTITRELINILKGRISLESTEGQGTTFTVVLPRSSKSVVLKSARLSLAPEPEYPIADEKSPNSMVGELDKATTDDDSPAGSSEQSDQQALSPSNRLLLIIEDDDVQAKIIKEMAGEQGFEALIASNGKTGLALAKKYQPQGIILDIGLPDLDGLEVMQWLKNEPQTKSIPVHFMSGKERQMEALRLGAIGYLQKPASITEINEVFDRFEQITARHMQSIMLFSSDALVVEELGDLLTLDELTVVAAGSAEKVIFHLGKENYDCMIIDETTPSEQIYQVLELMERDPSLVSLPVVLYAQAQIAQDIHQKILKYSKHIVVKEAISPERMLDEVGLFLHWVDTKLPLKQRTILERTLNRQDAFKGKTVLLVDDDARNIFALANVFEDEGITVIVGKNGKEGLQQLAQHPNIDLVLMDIMMPEMDGYTAMGEIRQQSKYAKLPIIALTAKAMKGDRQKCIDAGANDYVSKPVETELLLNVMRVWLYR